jgi:hypothetical protein
MRDLYSEDIEDRIYTDQMILEDVRALVKAGQREGPLLDYKSDVSEKDNWPETVAAFANSFGGLIIFGIEGKNDQPRRLTGFDPKGVEVKTKLTSMVIDRIQPRPDFSVRVVAYDQDPTKEVALLRVSEGRNVPYMHSKGHEHRIYIRVGAQKAEADYLQLSSLLERHGRIESETVASAHELFGSDSQLHVAKPPGTNQVSLEFVRFILSPRNIGADLRLNLATERLFRQCVVDIVGVPEPTNVIRSKRATIFQRGAAYLEQRFGIATRGGVGFVSPPGITVEQGLVFVPTDFCRCLVEFLSISSLFYERIVRFHGSCVLYVSLEVRGGAKLFPGFPTSASHLQGAQLFAPPLDAITGSLETQIEVAMHPISTSRMHDYLEAVLIDLVRPCGSVLDPKFQEGI